MFSSKIRIILFLLLSSLFGIYPYQYNLDEDLKSYNDFNMRSETQGWPSRSIVDLRLNYNNEVFIGTGGGLGKIILSNNGNGEIVSYNQFADSNLPIGGTPSIIIEDYNGGSIIVLSGVSSDDLGVYGTGISWSFDDGQTWQYIDQPKDIYIPNCTILSCNDPRYEETCECWPSTTACNWNNSEQSCEYLGPYTTFNWYGQTATNLRLTTSYNNISYDISADINNEYIYAASWAGSLRRFKFTDINPSWEVVPLPMDYEDSLICGELPNNYYLDPRDLVGFDNHKVFSVYVQDDIIWAGTANGINKGYINEDNCIDWYHYTVDNDGLSGDWIIGFLEQSINVEDLSQIRIWAITWDLFSEPHGLTYTDDNGENWIQVNYFIDEETKVNNLYLHDNILYAPSNNGLYKTDVSTPQLWEEINIPETIIDEMGSEKSQSVLVHYDRLLLGLNQGLLSKNIYLDEWNKHILDNPVYDNMLIYPNPYMIDEEVQYLTIKVESSQPAIGPLTIYDFSMEEVQEISCNLSDYNINQNSQYCFWNGENFYGTQVSNGVYFCKYKSLNGYVWDKVIVVNTR